MAVVIKDVEPRQFAIKGGEQPAVLAGEGLNLSGLEAGFIDAQDQVVGEPQLLIQQPDVDDVSEARFPVIVEPFDTLTPGQYRIFVRLPDDDVAECDCGGEKPTKKEPPDQGDEPPLDTCYLFTEPIDFL
jgi:hypothetical protein